MPPSSATPSGMDAARARRPVRARQGVAIPADAVLNFARYEQAPLSPDGSPPAASRSAARARGARARHRTREHFVTANCRFAVNPDKAGALTGALSDADAPLDWEAVDVVFVERDADEDAAHQCPICLQELSCPKITPCGHVFDHVCLLQHVAHSRTPPGSPLMTEPAPADTCVKCPLCSHLFAMSALRNVAFREVAPVKVGAVCEMALVSTSGRCTIAAEYSTGNAHSIPAHVDSFERMFSRFVFASRPFLLGMLGSMASDLRNALTQDASLKPFVNQASRSVKASRQAIRRRSSPESRPLTMMASTGVSAHTVATTVDVQFSSSSLDSDPTPIRKMVVDSEPREGPAGQYSGPKLRLFYQARDGQNIFLHPICHRALLFDNDNDLSNAKASIAGIVIDSERFSMDEAKSKRYRFLRHLPEGCEVTLVELDLSGVLSPKTLAHFASDFNARKNARSRKAKESQKESARVSKMQSESLQDYFRNGNPRYQNSFSNVTVDRTDEALFPALGGADAAPASTGSSPPEASEAQAIPASGTPSGSARELGTSPGSAWGGAEISSYSSVASNMGLFPALGAESGAVASTPPSPARGVWAPSPPAANNAIVAGTAQGTRRHRRGQGRQTFTVFSNAGSNYRP